jgi:hypothetical protein
MSVTDTSKSTLCLPNILLPPENELNMSSKNELVDEPFDQDANGLLLLYSGPFESAKFVESFSLGLVIAFKL